MLPASMVELAGELRAMPADELPALRDGFARVAADESEPTRRRSIAAIFRSVIDGMPEVDPTETLRRLDGLLTASGDSWMS
jgi:hypothetical protein